MRICNYCETPNREGELFCEECGSPLTNARSVSTHVFQKADLEEEPHQPLFSGTAILGKSNEVLLHVAGAKDPLNLDVKNAIMVGRSDPSSNQIPDLDLNPYGAAQGGVSRVHARLERSENNLNLIDLNSSNGTYVNGQRLVAYQPRILHDGDELRFGLLATRIYFRPNST